MSHIRKYYRINRSWNHLIVGPGICAEKQVMILTGDDKNSFINECERQSFNEFVNKTVKDESRSYIDNFACINQSNITIINAVKISEALRGIDILDYRIDNTPFHVRGLDYIISEKFIKIIEKYKLPDYNKIKLKIEGFNTNYYLIGFPVIIPEKFNYKKSIFYDHCLKKNRKFKNHEEYYNDNNYLDGTVDYFKVVLFDRYSFDVLHLPGSLFFSENLIVEIEKMNIIALEINKKVTVEC